MNDFNGSEYKYIAIKNIIREKIISGEYQNASIIPSENSLAQTHAVSKAIIRKAIDILVYEGLLKRVQGKGIYVVPKLEGDLEVLGGFSQTMKEKNINPKKKILKRKKIRANKKYADIFKMYEGALLYYIKRIDYANDEPVSIEEIYIPFNLIRGIENIDLQVFSIFELYKMNNIFLTKAIQTLEITKLPQVDAKKIGMDKDKAVYLFTYTSYDKYGRTVEFARNYTRGDKCTYKIKFYNKEE